jgi:hypothetical protein
MSLSHYHKSIRKLTTAFASLFNNIVLVRYNPDGSENQRIIVPIEFGDKEKYTKRMEGDPELYKKIQVLLPRMSYELTGFKYDSSRKLNTNNRNFAPGLSADSALAQYNPVPYDFGFSLTIYTRNIEDGNQILEQILPYFTPDYSLKINMVPEMGISKTVPIVLDSVQPMIDSDGMFNSEVRTVMWTLQFNIKGFIFGAIKDVPIIKDANTSIVSTTISTKGDSTFDGVCCSGNFSISFDMMPSVCRNYKNGEVVFQGLNLENGYASARVYDWNANTNILMLNEVCGTFKLNQPIMGVDSLASKIPLTVNPEPIPSLTIITSVHPATANAANCWTANVTMTEWGNTR